MGSGDSKKKPKTIHYRCEYPTRYHRWYTIEEFFSALFGSPDPNNQYHLWKKEAFLREFEIELFLLHFPGDVGKEVNPPFNFTLISKGWTPGSKPHEPDMHRLDRIELWIYPMGYGFQGDDMQSVSILMKIFHLFSKCFHPIEENIFIREWGEVYYDELVEGDEINVDSIFRCLDDEEKMMKIVNREI